MIEYLIPAAVLKAAIYCVARKDVRFYLQGVAIDRGHVIATDGNRMFYVKIKGLDADLPQIIIPTEAVELFFKRAKIKNSLLHDFSIKITLESNDKGQLELDNIVETFIPINGKYPDWTRVSALKEGSILDGDFPSFNWEYMADFQKMAKLLGSKKAYPITKLTPVVSNPPKAYVDFPNSEKDSFEAYGVLMGLKR